ncbi:hypothetical protein ACFE04_011870 [Oxalis oulophora]
MGHGGAKCYGVDMDQTEGGGKKRKIEAVGKAKVSRLEVQREQSEDGNLVGPFYTWKKNSNAGDTIMEKLDRIVGSEEWSLMFPDAGVTNLKITASRFKFENFWVDNPKCLNVVENAWNVNNGWVENVVNVQRKLKDWSKIEFGSLSSQIKRNQQKLQALLEGVDPCGHAKQIWEVETRLNGDKWVMGSIDGKVMINLMAMAIPEHVVDLLEDYHMKWNERLIRKLFLVDQATAIMTVPLGHGSHEDQWIWNGCKSG